MYLKYSTEGFVLGNYSFGEYNKIFFIFTKDLGIIKASAQSVRRPGLKLKSGLEDYSWGIFTFVKGKNGWKIIDAMPEVNSYFSLIEKREVFICASVTSLFKKLLPEEEPHPELFDELREGLFFMQQNRLSEDLVKNLESLLVLKALAHLGYLEKENWLPFLESSINFELLNNFSDQKRKSIEVINRSLKASQLV